MNAHEPTEEELRSALEEQMRRISVDDLLLQTVVSLVNLGGRRLGLAPSAGEDEKDLAQGRLAIEATRALLPLLPEEHTRPIRDALSQLQMAFARESRQAAEAAEPPAEGKPSEGAPAAQAGPDQAREDEAERARARAKIWTPPGT